MHGMVSAIGVVRPAGFVSLGGEEGGKGGAAPVVLFCLTSRRTRSRKRGGLVRQSGAEAAAATRRTVVDLSRCCCVTRPPIAVRVPCECSVLLWTLHSTTTCGWYTEGLINNHLFGLAMDEGIHIIYLYI